MNEIPLSTNSLLFPKASHSETRIWFCHYEHIVPLDIDSTFVVLNSKCAREHVQPRSSTFILEPLSTRQLGIIFDSLAQEEVFHFFFLWGLSFLTRQLGFHSLTLQTLALTAVSFFCSFIFILFAFCIHTSCTISYCFVRERKVEKSFSICDIDKSVPLSYNWWRASALIKYSRALKKSHEPNGFHITGYNDYEAYAVAASQGFPTNACIQFILI